MPARVLLLLLSIAGKCLQVLTEIVPDDVKRAAIMFNPDAAAGSGSFFQLPFEEAARSIHSG